LKPKKTKDPQRFLMSRPEEVTRADLDAWAEELFRELDQRDTFGPDADEVALRIELAECTRTTNDDNAAQMVRRGFYLGTTLMFWRDSLRQKASTRSQSEIQKVRDKKLVARYWELIENDHSDLSARQALRVEFGLTLTRINQILKEQGVVRKK